MCFLCAESKCKKPEPPCLQKFQFLLCSLLEFPCQVITPKQISKHKIKVHLILLLYS